MRSTEIEASTFRRISDARRPHPPGFAGRPPQQGGEVRGALSAGPAELLGHGFPKGERSPVHVATVPDLDDEDQNVAITDLVQHAVVADSDSEIVGAGRELLAAWWSWVGRQRSDGVPDP
jgi:hypothetical protein